MLTNRSDSIAKLTRNNFMWSFVNCMCINAHADEEPPATEPTPSPNTPPTIDIETLLARVRKEEKDKLYGEIKKLKDENLAYKGKIENYVLSIGSYQTEAEKLRAEIDKLKQAPGDAEKVLQDKIEKLQKELDDAKKNTPDEKALREQIAAEYEVKSYMKDKLAENKDNILSSFASDVKGSTKEEIDASIATAVEKTVQIKKDLGLLDEEGNPVAPSTKPSPKDKDKKDANNKKTPPVAAPAFSATEEFDPDFVRNLDPRSPEYAEFRKKMGLH